jgi:iron complex outermembrane receptor protein
MFKPFNRRARHRALSVLLLGGSAASALLASAPAFAAPSSEVTEVTVTARRRNENVQHVPIAITAISAGQIDSSGAYRLDQLKQMVPSVQTLTFNARNANVAIRGLGGNVSLTNDGLEQGVGFYVDDVYYGRPGQSQFDLVDLQQIDVLRGPQGTLFGKNTTAGAINITTREPSQTPGGTLEVSGGNFGYRQVRASLTGPIIPGVLAFRASVAGTHRDGYIHNLYNGQHLGNYDNFTSRAQLLFTPNAAFKARIIGDYALQRQNCCISVVAGEVTTRADGTPLPNAFAARAARIGYTLPPVDPFNYDVDINSRVRTQMYTGGLSAKLDWTTPDYIFTSITAGRFWNWIPENDVDGISKPATLQGRIIDRQKQLSQEFRIASAGSHTVDWVAGAYYFWQKLPGISTFLYGPDGAEFNLPPALYPTAAKAALATAALDHYQLTDYSKPVTRSYAAFGQATWHVTPKWDLTGGLRYTREDKSGVFTQAVTGGADLSTFAAADQAYVQSIRNIVGTTNAYNVKDGEGNVSGLLTVDYNLSSDILLYGTYSRGYKSGGINLTNLPAAVPKVVDPERVDNVELGFKSTLLNRNLTFNIAAFRTDTHGYQTNIFDSSLFITYIANIGLVRSQGIETDLRFRPDNHFGAYLSAAYDDATYVDYKKAPPGVEWTGLLPSTANYIDLSGRPLPGAPKWAASFGGDYNHSLGDGLDGYAGADVNVKSAFFAAINDAPSSRVNGYGLVNLRLGLRWHDGHDDLSLWVRNAGDTHYFQTLGAGNTGASGLITGLPGEPRTWGLTFRHSFGQ